MNEQIQEAIDQAKQDSDFSMFKGEYHFETKKQLLSLLKLMAEDAHKRGALDVDKWSYTKHHIHNLFEDYWKTLTEQL